MSSVDYIYLGLTVRSSRFANPTISTIAQTLAHPLLMIPIYLFIYLFVVVAVVCPIQDNSKKEWEFRKAVTVLTYCNCHPIPVPLNIISTLVVGLIRKKVQEKDVVDAKSVLVRCW